MRFLLSVSNILIDVTSFQNINLSASYEAGT